MQFDEVVRTLERAGTAQNRKVYARHGIGPNMYGVSYANLGALAKKIKRNQPLAEQLWKTGNHDCRALAIKIADPAGIKKSTLVAWGKTPGNRCLAMDLAKLVVETPHALKLGSKWCESSNPMQQQFGWTVIAALAGHVADPGLDEFFATCLTVIEHDLQSSENFTRYAMNNALIAIGGRNEKLKKLALAAAKRIGKVEVDHGETGCKTPEAAAYIQKMWSRKAPSSSR
jgi:3-methyladenine DNA glycosylase AlkD